MAHLLRWLRPALLVAVITSILAAHLSGSQDAQADTHSQAAALPVELHEALIGQINKLNPLFSASNPVDADITSLIYEGLTSINQYGEVVPDLAEGWVVSADGLDYVFALRQDVLWQDGIPFNSADVAYTIRTIRSRDFPGDPALRDFWRTVEMTVIDDHTLRFRLVQPLSSFPERLRQGIVPYHALAGAPIGKLDQHPFNLSPIGTGPYQIESLFASGGQISGISLRVAPNYRLRPEGAAGYAINRLVFRTYPSLDEAIAAFQRGEVNSLGNIPNVSIDQIRTLPGLGVYTSVAPAVGMIIFNWKQDAVAYLRDQRMRLALAYATNRQSAVEKSLAGRAIPADSPILPNSWAFNPDAHYPTPNAEQAAQFLQVVSFEPVTAPPPENPGEAATEEAPTPTPTPVPIRREFKIMVVDDPGVAGVAFEIASQWNTLGFIVELDMVDYGTFVTRLQAGDFDVALVEYSFEPKADPDQFVFWHSGQYQIGQNYGGMDDAYISSLLLQARTDPNGLNRKADYDEFQRAFATRAPALVLYNPLFFYAVDNRLKGIQLDFISTPSDRFRTIQDWTFAP